MLSQRFFYSAREKLIVYLCVVIAMSRGHQSRRLQIPHRKSLIQRLGVWKKYISSSTEGPSQGKTIKMVFFWPLINTLALVTSTWAWKWFYSTSWTVNWPKRFPPASRFHWHSRWNTENTVCFYLFPEISHSVIVTTPFECRDVSNLSQRHAERRQSHRIATQRGKEGRDTPGEEEKQTAGAFGGAWRAAHSRED